MSDSEKVIPIPLQNLFIKKRSRKLMKYNWEITENGLRNFEDSKVEIIPLRSEDNPSKPEVS